MRFSDGITTIAGCGAQPVDPTTGVATCTQTYTTVGAHPISAAYLGDASFLASTSTTLNQTVNAASISSKVHT